MDKSFRGSETFPGVAIDARQQTYPDQPRYAYQPFAGRDEEFRFNDETFARVIKDYNTKDLAI